MAKSTRSNLSILIVAIFFLVIIFRLFYLQIIKGEQYQEISRNNFIREAIIPSPRGFILDRNGKQIAYSRPVVNLYIKNTDKLKLNEIKNNLSSYIKLEPSLKLKNEKTYSGIQRRLLKKDLSIDEIYLVEDLFKDVSNLELIVDYIRVYPYGEAASHITGHLTSNDKKDFMYGNLFSNRKGANGLEKFFDKTLTGNVGSKYLYVDSRGREVIGQEIENDEFKDIEKGNNIKTTIDIELQKIIYDQFVTFNGAVIVSELKSGEILALVSKPGFDPNLFSQPISSIEWNKLKADKSKPFLNRAFLVSSPPGSIIKIITAVAGLEEGVVSPSTEYYCPGYTKVGNRNFRCWLKGGHGMQDLKKALISSCDVYFYKVGLNLGIKKYSSWLKKFGIGDSDDYLPFKQKSGVVPDKKFIDKYLNGKFYSGDMVNVAIGQGYLTLNVVQANKIISIIANDGEFVPYKLFDSMNQSKSKKLKIKPKNLSVIKDGLLGVVNDSNGTGFHAKDDLLLAGKTGTAQVISKDSSNYGYGKYKNHGWFTAYYPFNAPRIAITVFAEHGDSGGRAGGPIIKKIVSYYKENYGEKSDELR
ncbi:MAG: penicillin-binding protein 2 [Candidatus Dadabacteria bacterium]|nr:penicillin-binding protein 2 [Candidatus Dadabacteria bacterium]|tara:strand:+ start:28848 stop:30605 length:1758 start_codon:yes stop_codon:yes gene_type:complete